MEPLLAAVDGLGSALGHGAHQHRQVGRGGDLGKSLVSMALCQGDCGYHQLAINYIITFTARKKTYDRGIPQVY